MQEQTHEADHSQSDQDEESLSISDNELQPLQKAAKWCNNEEEDDNSSSSNSTSNQGNDKKQYI
jgi:hypothetical protein